MLILEKFLVELYNSVGVEEEEFIVFVGDNLELGVVVRILVDRSLGVVLHLDFTFDIVLQNAMAGYAEVRVPHLILLYQMLVLE